MRRRRLLAAVAVCLVVGIAVLLLLIRDTKEQPDLERDPARSVARAHGSADTHTVGQSSAQLDWLIEPGVAPRRIAGRVVEDGRPLPSARVQLRSPRFHYTGTPPPTRITDDEGRFDFGLQAVTEYLVMASKDGYGASWHRTQLSDPTANVSQLELSLSTCAQADFGVVTDLGGTPIKAATVKLSSRIGRHFFPVFETNADSQGRFSICRAPFTVVEVVAPGYGGIRLGRTMPINGWRVALFPAAAIEGRVLSVTDEPIAGAIVIAENVAMAGQRSIMSHGGKTDEAGHFRIAGLTPQTYILSATARSHRGGGTSVTVRPEQVQAIEMRLTRCRMVAGVVLEGETPVSGAEVTGGGEAVTTQTDGSFVLPCEPATAFKFDVRRYDMVGGKVPAGDKDIDDIVVRVKARASISGHVRADHTPVTGAIVTVDTKSSFIDLGYQPSRRFQGFTDQNGAYTVRGVPPGTYDLIVRNQSGSRRAPPKTVTVKGRENITGIDVALTNSKSLHGVVVDPDGKPIGNTDVELRGVALPKEINMFKNPFKMTTNTRGEFSFSGLGVGHYTLCIHWWCHGKGSPYAPLEGGQHTAVLTDDDDVVNVRLVIRAHTSLSISGHVRDDRGVPVALATVSTYTTGSTLTDDAGRFTLSGAVDQPETIRAQSTNGATTEKRNVRPGTGDVNIVLPRGVAVAGRIVGGEGVCTTTTTDDTYGLFGDSRTATSRNFLFEGLRHGEYTIRTSCQDGGAASTSVELESGQTKHITLVVGSASSVRGRALTFLDNHPVAGAVCFTPSSSSQARYTSDENGYFEISDVFPGDVTIMCGRGDQANLSNLSGSAITTTAPGDRAQVNVYLITASMPMVEELDLHILGATLRESSSELVFSNVVADKIAARAGVQNGDIVLSVSGADARGDRTRAAKATLSFRPPGTAVPITVRRAGSTQSLTIKYPAIPESMRP